ncbi:hypothetical protein KIPB_000355 [Kipferlia bialata]|uniref:Dynein regulatory complex protein 1/2 N-terminal domain-containing protein n=1 Tax=Kipferlia bialata TaxID=797122 RepID=A0A9K3GEB1_9EUKA|nr:hypothetical protein KIPB_000355 [Kipferlia bialata]|eukprot:g355.t1
MIPLFETIPSAIRHPSPSDAQIPEELAADLVVLRRDAAEILRSKDEVIDTFEQELRARDDEYLHTLQEGGQEVKDVLSMIRETVSGLRKEYQSALLRIDDAFGEERQALVSAQRQEIRSLQDERNKQESTLLNERIRIVGGFQDTLQEQQVRDAEQYNLAKVWMCCLTDAGSMSEVQSLCDAVSGVSGLTSIDLSGNHLTHSGAVTLVSSLAVSPCISGLTHLDLSGIPFGTCDTHSEGYDASALEALCQCLLRAESLTSLSLNHCGLDTEAVATICGVSLSASLTALSLRGNATTAIPPLPSHLCSLDLSDNPPMADIASFVSALPPSLVSLSVCLSLSSRVSPSDVDALRQISHLRSLESLSLKGSMVSDPHTLGTVLSSLRKLAGSLRHLDLSGVSLTGAVYPFCSMCRRLRLESLSLSGSLPLTKADQSLVLQGIPPTLQDLDLSHNTLTDSSLPAIRDALARLDSLTSLSLAGNSLSSECVYALPPAQLTSLDLSHTLITAPPFQCRSLFNVMDLSLTGCPLSSTGRQGMLNRLYTLCATSEVSAHTPLCLSLSSDRLQHRHRTPIPLGLSDACISSLPVGSLHLQGEALLASDVACIVGCIRAQRTLTSLSLQGCSVSDINPILTALAAGSALHTLDLSDMTSDTPIDCEVLGQALTACPDLRTVSLARVALPRATLVLRALSHLTCLTRLCLDGVCLSGQGVGLVAEGLGTWRCLQTLSLSCIGGGLDPVLSALGTCPTLHHLDLSHNVRHQPGAYDVLGCVQSLPSLETLCLTGTPVEATPSLGRWRGLTSLHLGVVHDVTPPETDPLPDTPPLIEQGPSATDTFRSLSACPALRSLSVAGGALTSRIGYHIGLCVTQSPVTSLSLMLGGSGEGSPRVQDTLGGVVSGILTGLDRGGRLLLTHLKLGASSRSDPSPTPLPSLGRLLSLCAGASPSPSPPSPSSVPSGVSAGSSYLTSLELTRLQMPSPSPEAPCVLPPLLQRLVMGGGCSSDHAAVSVVQALPPSLHTLDLRRCCLSSEAASALRSALTGPSPSLPVLRDLTLSNNPDLMASGVLFGQGTPLPPTLQRLCLSDVGMDSKATLRLCQSIRLCCALRHVVVSGNALFDKGCAMSLVQGLSPTHTLEWIHMGAGGVAQSDVEGVRAEVEGMMPQCRLTL